jgi:tyrosyl-tRNA synthetase
LETEIEIGVQDQLFNFQIARQLQESFGQKPQACIMLPVINGTDGRKMSKSFGNCIFLDEPANDIFGKVMSIPDSVMGEWFPLLTDKTATFDHPMDNKKALAFDIVRQLQDEDAAKDAQEFFERTVQQKELPNDIPEIQADTLVQAIQKIRNCSKTVCRTLLDGNGVRINGVVCKEDRPLTKGEVVQVGKRDFAKVS